MSQVHASILPFLIQAALVIVAPAAEENCPSSAQVQAALGTHAPRLVTASSEGNADKALTLILSPTLATGEMGLSLMDKVGRVKLYRLLPPPPGDHARDCAALADTVAFIIDRYFDEVELPKLPERPQPPPPPPPPSPPVVVEPKSEVPEFALAVTMGRRVPGGATDLGGYEFKLTGGAALTTSLLAGGRPWMDVSAGLVGIAERSWDYKRGAGTAKVVRSGVDLALLLRWRVWHGWLYAGPLASIEMVWVDWRDADTTGPVQREIRFQSAAGLRTGYQYLWHRRFFARADMTGCVSLLRQEIAAQSSSGIPLFESPQAYLTMAFGVGIWF
jgi:hypothetical protein